MNETTSNAVNDAIALALVDSFRLVTFIAAGLAVASAIVTFLFIDRFKLNKN